MTDQKPKDFNEAAATWDEKPRRVILAHAVATAITNEVPLNADMKALEFGCGTGLVSLELAPLIGHLTAVDSAQEMLAVLEDKARQARIRNISTWHVDPHDAVLPEESFHLIFSSMVLHHVPETAKLIRLLQKHLKPGGYIALADLDKEDGTFHDNPVGVPHHGFDQDKLKSILEDAGCGNVRSIIAHKIRKDREGQSRDYPVFLMVGRKPL